MCTQSFERLPCDLGDELEVLVRVQGYESCLFCGRRDQEVRDGWGPVVAVPGRRMTSGLSRSWVSSPQTTEIAGRHRDRRSEIPADPAPEELAAGYAGVAGTSINLFERGLRDVANEDIGHGHTS